MAFKWRKLEAPWKLIDDLARAESQEAMLAEAMAWLQRAFDVKRASILLFDDEGVMRFVASEGLSEDYRRAVEGHSPWRPDARDPEPITVSDVSADPSVSAYGEIFREEGIAALAFVPLSVAGRLIGKFVLYYPEPRAFDEEEIAIARWIGSKVAFALELRREAAFRTAVETFLSQSGPILSSSLDAGEILRSVAGLAVPRLADWCAVHLLDEGGTAVPVAIAHTDPEKEAMAWALQTRWPPKPDAPKGVYAVIRTGETALVPRLTPEFLTRVARDDAHREALQALRIHSGIVVPLAGRRGILGALTLIHAESQRTFRADDVALAEELGRRAALAVENARLFSEATAARRTAEHAARRLRILSEASEVLATSLDDETSLKRLAEFAVATMADYCITYAFDPPSTIRRVGLAHATPEKRPLVEALLEAGPPRLEDMGAGQVIRTGEPVLAAEVSDEMLARAAQNEAHLRALMSLKPRSSMVVPLDARGRTLGAIAFAATDDSGRRYDADDLLLAQELAGRGALLVNNARLYREAQEAVRARDDVAAVVSHDLRNPIHTILTACAVNRQPGLSEERRARNMEIIRRAGERMERLIGDLLELNRMEAGRLPLALQPVSISALADEIRSAFVPIADASGIRLTVEAEPDLPWVRADSDRLMQVVGNLLDNALKFTPEGGNVQVAARTIEGAVEISVSDDGPGIAPDDLPRIFERYWQAKGAARGAGLGLAIAQGIVEAHGGTLRAESRPEEGARFILRLPPTDGDGAQRRNTH